MNFISVCSVLRRVHKVRAGEGVHGRVQAQLVAAEVEQSGIGARHSVDGGTHACREFSGDLGHRRSLHRRIHGLRMRHCVLLGAGKKKKNRFLLNEAEELRSVNRW